MRTWLGFTPDWLWREFSLNVGFVTQQEYTLTFQHLQKEALSRYQQDAPAAKKKMIGSDKTFVASALHQTPISLVLRLCFHYCFELCKSYSIFGDRELTMETLKWPKGFHVSSDQKFSWLNLFPKTLKIL